MPLLNRTVTQLRRPTVRPVTIGLTAAIVFSMAGCGILSQEKAFDTPARPSGLGQAYPSGSIVTLALAEQALLDAATRRTEIEEQYKRDESPCYDRFFVIRCVDTGKDRRRMALAEVRAVEVEADYIKRRDRADQRDKAQADRAAQDLAEAPQRLKQTQEREKAAADKALQRAADQATAAASEKRQAGNDPLARQRTHDAKVDQAQAAQVVDQGKRAANVAAFEKKQIDATEAQKKVAETKARKVAEAKVTAERAAADAAAAAATAAGKK